MSTKAQEFVLHIDISYWQALKKHPKIVEIVHAESQKSVNKVMDLSERRYRLKIVLEKIETALKEYRPILDQVYRHL